MAKSLAARHKLAALKKDGYVRLYGPTPTKPGIWRVLCRRPSHPATERTASSLDDAVRIYDLLVAWDRAQLPVVPRRGVGARNYDINFLAARTVGFLRTNGRAARYCDKVEDTLGLHVIPIIGGVLVSDWSQDHCVAVMDAARKKGLGPTLSKMSVRLCAPWSRLLSASRVCLPQVMIRWRESPMPPALLFKGNPPLLSQLPCDQARPPFLKRPRFSTPGENALADRGLGYLAALWALVVAASEKFWRCAPATLKEREFKSPGRLRAAIVQEASRRAKRQRTAKRDLQL